MTHLKLALLASVAAVLALAPCAGAQAGAEPQTEPIESAAAEAEAQAGSYADATVERAGGVQAAWQAYAEDAAASPASGGVPAPTDEAAALFAASGEQGASTVGFGAAASRSAAGGSSSSAALTTDSADVEPPLAPDEADGGPVFEEPHEAAGEEDDAGEGRDANAPAPADAAPPATPDEADPAAPEEVAGTGEGTDLPFVPLPADEPSSDGPPGPAPPERHGLVLPGGEAADPGLAAAVRPSLSEGLPVGPLAGATAVLLGVAVSLAVAGVTHPWASRHR